jgi:hypothetical protein
MIPFAELYQLLSRTQYLLSSIITPIFIVKFIYIPNSFIENDQYLGYMFSLIDLSFDEGNELLDFLLDERDKFKPHLKFEVKEWLYPSCFPLGLVQHYKLLINNAIDIIPSFF